MIGSIISNLKRVCRVLDDIPAHIENQKKITLAELNDVFEYFRDQFDDTKEAATIKKIEELRKEVMKKVEEFCIAIDSDVKEEINIVEE